MSLSAPSRATVWLQPRHPEPGRIRPTLFDVAIQGVKLEGTDAPGTLRPHSRLTGRKAGAEGSLARPAVQRGGPSLTPPTPGEDGAIRSMTPTAPRVVSKFGPNGLCCSAFQGQTETLPRGAAPARDHRGRRRPLARLAQAGIRRPHSEQVGQGGPPVLGASDP